MDTSLAPTDNRPYLGQTLFRPIWEGEETAVRQALLNRFGSSLCSRWASGERRPDGDSRAVVEEITAKTGAPILSKYWSMRVEVAA